MLHLIKLLALSLLVSSFPAHAAAPAGAEAQLKRISSFTSWDEVYASVKNTLPALIVDELKTATKNTPFPQIHVYKGQLAISGAEGGRINLAFAKNGVAILNGKPLDLLPLATVEAEVKRIEGLPDGKRADASLLRYLIPDADAAMIGTGLAALAYSGANSWKADACGEAELGSEDLEKTCPLMGVGMIQKVSTTEEAPETEEEKRKMVFYPIGLKCPNPPDNGLLEIIKKNQNGSSYRGRFFVKDRKVTKITLELAMAGKKFETMKDLALGPNLGEDDKDFARKSLRTIDPVREIACEGTPEQKARYAKILDVNRKTYQKIDRKENTAPESQMSVQ